MLMGGAGSMGGDGSMLRLIRLDACECLGDSILTIDYSFGLSHIVNVLAEFDHIFRLLTGRLAKC